MNQRLFRILGGKTEHYPYELENKYPRILDKIMSLWDSEEIEEYFLSLMVNDRENRIGFPPDIAAQIMHLSLVHAAQQSADERKDIWDAPSDAFVSFTPHPETDWDDPAEHLKNKLTEQGIPCTPEGLFEAVETGNRGAVALFIEAQSNIEIRDNRGWTPLMMAAFNGQDDIVSLLIQHDADVNSTDMDGNTALHWAAFAGHSACAELLIRHHAGINAANHFGWTPLMQATVRNHPGIISLLIGKGANLDVATKDGYTALHKAAASGYSAIVQLLLEHGADSSLKTSDGDTAEMLIRGTV